MKLALSLMLAALALPPIAVAQEADGEVLAVVRALFDAMRAKDTVALRATLYPGARLMTAGRDRDGVPAVQAESVDAFVRAVGSLQRHLDERIWNAEVRVDGNLAAVWTPYAFYVDGTFSHCGVDAFQLALTPDGWKIIHVTDTRRREGCSEPPDHAR